MTEFGDLEARLHRLGEQPIEPATATAHLSQLTQVVPRPGGYRRATIAAAFAAGLMLGGGGLAAAADRLPEPAQNVAHDALGAVGLRVPDGNENQPAGPGLQGNQPEDPGSQGNQPEDPGSQGKGHSKDDGQPASDPVVCAQADNHGEYVSNAPHGEQGRSEAAHSDCGKSAPPPARGGEGGSGGAPASPGEPQGPPAETPAKEGTPGVNPGPPNDPPQNGNTDHPTADNHPTPDDHPGPPER